MTTLPDKEMLQQQTCRLCCYYLLYMCIFTAVSPTYFSGGTFQDHTISLNICRRKTHCVSTWIVCNVTECSKHTWKYALLNVCTEIHIQWCTTWKRGKNKQLELNPESLTWAASALCGLMIAWWSFYGGQSTHRSSQRSCIGSAPIDYHAGFSLSTSLPHIIEHVFVFWKF